MSKVESHSNKHLCELVKNQKKKKCVCVYVSWVPSSQSQPLHCAACIRMREQGKVGGWVGGCVTWVLRKSVHAAFSLPSLRLGGEEEERTKGLLKAACVNERRESDLITATFLVAAVAMRGGCLGVCRGEGGGEV